MKWAHFQKENLEKTVRLHPPTQFMDSGGIIDDDWIIVSFPSDKSVEFQHVKTGVKYEAGKDLIHCYTSDPDRTRQDEAGREHGILTLHGQLFVKDGIVDVRMSGRPGMAVPARRAEEWTNPVEIDISPFVPPTAVAIRFQYKLRCDDPHVPLMIAVGTQDYRPALLQFSGPVGVADIQLLNKEQLLFVSTSHPEILWEIYPIGWEDGE